jgi:hypothetical protein
MGMAAMAARAEVSALKYNHCERLRNILSTLAENGIALSNKANS